MSNSFSSETQKSFFKLEYREDGVYLRVFPPVNKNEKSYTLEILETLKKKRVQNYKSSVIEKVVSQANNEFTKIAEAQEEVKIDATVSVEVSEDKMQAFIIISPPLDGRMLTSKEILENLKQNGIVYGVDTEVIENIVREPKYKEKIKIAQGKTPLNGKNGEVKFKFNHKKERKPLVAEDGTVDYRELNIIENVKKGQVLCALLQPKDAESGMNIFGKEIQGLNGKPAKLPRGQNVEISEDEQELVASIDGQVEYIEGKVNVFSTYEVPADVDTSTGNIDFVGNVIVRGNVLAGFKIQAGGYVEVVGVVEGASIIAGGDIILRRGIQGGEKAYLSSGNDIVSRFIENSVVEAAQNIKAEAIMHSHVKCGQKLELIGKKGLLVGGVIRAGREIIAKVIGSHMATITEVEVGTDPTLREKYKKTKEEIKKQGSEKEKMEKIVIMLEKLEQVNALTADKREMLEKTRNTLAYYKTNIEELKENLIEIEEKLQEAIDGKIRANNFVYPGTKVIIGTCMKYIKEKLEYCTLYRDGADIRVGPIDK